MFFLISIKHPFPSKINLFLNYQNVLFFYTNRCCTMYIDFIHNNLTFLTLNQTDILGLLRLPTLFPFVKCQNNDKYFFMDFYSFSHFFGVKVNIIFLSIWLHNLLSTSFGSTFWISFHKLHTIICRNFDPLLLTVTESSYL